MEDTVRRSLERAEAAPALRWVSASGSHVGMVRKLNEDAYLDRPDIGLWVVADGLGGESAGDRASALVVEALGNIAAPAGAAAFLAEVRDNLHAVNKLLRLEARVDDTPRIIASTVVALLVYDRHFACAWAGDSRLYLLRNGQFRQVSHDHSEVQEMVDQGMLAAIEARHHPRGNVLTRAVGARDELLVDLRQDQIRGGDLFLLCSDGLTKMLDDDEIASLLDDRPVEFAVEALIEAALSRGGSDNVTVVAVKIVAAEDDHE